MFPKIKSAGSLDEERFFALESLSPEERVKADGFSRMEMVKSDDDLVSKELEAGSFSTKEIVIRGKSKTPPLPGVNNDNLLKALEKNSDLSRYSDNGEDFYQIRVLSGNEEFSVVSFKEAFSEKILDGLLENRLKGKYNILSEKEKAKFLDDKGKEKPFAEIKNQLGALLFSDVLQKMDEKKAGVFDGALDSYADCLLYLHMQALRQGDLEVKGPWSLIQKNVEITKNYADTPLKNKVFAVSQDGFLSEVFFDNKEPVFFRFLNKERDEKTELREREKKKAVLSTKAKGDFIEKMFVKENTIILSGTN